MNSLGSPIVRTIPARTRVPHPVLRLTLAPTLVAALVASLPGEARPQSPEWTSPRESPGVPLALEEAIQIALTRSPALSQAEGQRRMEGASEWEGWDRILPSVWISSGLNQSSILQRTASDPITGGIVQLPDSLIQVRETFGTQAVVGADWTIFDGGRSVQAIRRSRADVRASELAFDAARVRIAADVTLAYLDALEASAVAEALRAETARAAELERTAMGRFEAGDVPEIDLLQARLAASDAEVSLLEAEAQERDARFALFEHLRLPPHEPRMLVDPDEPDLEALPDAEELRRMASHESTEVAAFRARLTAAERTLDANRWWFLPSVAVGATWVRSEFGETRDAVTLAPRNQQTYYRFTLSWDPLERPGGTSADRRRASAGVELARAELAVREAALDRGVEGALDRLSRARVLRERSEVNMRLAERQREQAEERYRLGAAPLVERLTAEALAAEAIRQEIVARYAGLRALAELERASGVRLFRTGRAAPP
jgi:outer membrane protein